MKEYLLELVSQKTGFNARMNCMREYLQAYALRIMHEQGVFQYTVFIGGTALRLLHEIPRFSEDLDFSLAGPPKYPFVTLIKMLKDEFLLAGYELTASYNEEKTVQHSFLRFEGLMFEAGLSPFKSQKVSIKIEVDTNPPGGAHTETRIITKFFPLAIWTYDVPSLFAGKTHALLSRKYMKGRDLFDLGWYISKWKNLSPNMEFLHNALIQTGWQGEMPSESNWRSLLRGVVEKAAWHKVREDVVRFLENPADANIFTQENILRLLQDDTP